MRKYLTILPIVLLTVMLMAGCAQKDQEPEPAAKETAEGQETAGPEEITAFRYIHDPRDNPEAMKDILVDESAVYGFAPDPESARLGSFADYDWSDPDFVASAKQEREQYHHQMDSMTDIIYRMRDEGASVEEIARAVSAERNRLRIASYGKDPEGLAKLKESNLKTYGHEEGPTPDQLYEQYGSWAVVLQKAFSTNMGMDAVCGLYDEYYQLYIELGYIDSAVKE